VSVVNFRYRVKKNRNKILTDFDFLLEEDDLVEEEAESERRYSCIIQLVLLPSGDSPIWKT
jgi:hypothetical protein